MYSSPTCLCKYNGWVSSSPALPLSQCNHEWRQWARAPRALWFPSNRSPVVCQKWPLWASPPLQSVCSTVCRGKSIFNSCLFGQRHNVFLSLEFGSTVGSIKSSRSDQELPLMGDFSWSIQQVCFCPLTVRTSGRYCLCAAMSIEN